MVFTRSENQKKKEGYTHVNSRGKTLFLHFSESIFKNGYKLRKYWFSKQINSEKFIPLPENMIVGERSHNGFCYLKCK